MVFALCEVGFEFSSITWIRCTECTRISYTGPRDLEDGACASIQRDTGCQGSPGLSLGSLDPSLT